MDIFKSWLNARKITDNIIEEFEIHWWNNRIVIPVHDDCGAHIFNKYRRNPMSDEGPKYSYDAGATVSLFGLDKAKICPTILITEGELDCLVAWSMNIPAVSSTGGALSFQSDWFGWFKNKDVIICYDNDTAGGEGMVRTLRILPDAKIMFIPDRPGIKDISDYVTAGGDLHELLKTAKHFKDIDDVKDSRAERTSLWLSTHFHDAYIKSYEKPVKTMTHRSHAFGDALSRAKGYPMTNLIDFNRNSARCLWHSEREPSLHYYSDTNNAYCFGGCGKSYDSIDAYMKINNCSFKEAVKQLQK